MKTKWGSCNHRAGNIRLNTEAEGPGQYVVVHEMLHPAGADPQTSALWRCWIGGGRSGGRRGAR